MTAFLIRKVLEKKQITLGVPNEEAGVSWFNVLAVHRDHDLRRISASFT
jgi:hypothetical protein